MTYEEKKAWLGRYREAEKKYNRLSERLAEARESSQHTTQSLSAVPSGSGDGQSIVRAIERTEDLAAEVNAQHELSIRIYREILDILKDNISDGMDYVILHKRYLESLNWERIASDTHFSLRWVYTRHHNAVERIEL